MCELSFNPSRQSRWERGRARGTDRAAPSDSGSSAGAGLRSGRWSSHRVRLRAPRHRLISAPERIGSRIMIESFVDKLRVFIEQEFGA